MFVCVCAFVCTCCKRHACRSCAYKLPKGWVMDYTFMLRLSIRAYACVYTFYKCVIHLLRVVRSQVCDPPPKVLEVFAKCLHEALKHMRACIHKYMSMWHLKCLPKQSHTFAESSDDDMKQGQGFFFSLHACTCMCRIDLLNTDSVMNQAETLCPYKYIWSHYTSIFRRGTLRHTIYQ